MRVYRFLNRKYGLLAISERRLRVSCISDTNDPFEWATPNGASARERKKFSKKRLDFSKKNGLLCFSRDWHNPLLWSHYSDRHKGICLGFEVADDVVEKVNYRSRRVPCDWSRFSSDDNYTNSIFKQISLAKFKHWQYENEVRCFINLDHDKKDCGMYFFDFSSGLELKEVIVAASSTIMRSEVHHALGNLKDSVLCKKARLAFTEFRIVEQREASLWR